VDARDSFLEKAARCRRLAASLPNENEPIKHALLALAQEFETEAARLAIGDAPVGEPA
jgi:hypothetical protein